MDLSLLHLPLFDAGHELFFYPGLLHHIQLLSFPWFIVMLNETSNHPFPPQWFLLIWFCVMGLLLAALG